MYSAKPQNLAADMPVIISRTEQHACVAELVAQQAAATPSALAVSCGQESLTYGELERRANRLANYLRRAGVGRNIAAGLYLDRSLDMVIAALAVLKAGGAYIPLDPAQPIERLAFMLRDSDACVVVSHSRLGEKPPPVPGKRFWSIGPRMKFQASRKVNPKAQPSLMISPTLFTRPAQLVSRRGLNFPSPACRTSSPGICGRFKLPRKIVPAILLR